MGSTSPHHLPHVTGDTCPGVLPCASVCRVYLLSLPYAWFSPCVFTHSVPCIYCCRVPNIVHTAMIFAHGNFPISLPVVTVDFPSAASAACSPSVLTMPSVSPSEVR